MKNRFHLVVAVLAVLAVLAVAASQLRAQATQATAADPLAAVTGWFCPMHPDHTAHEAGRCPICGMALIAGDQLTTVSFTFSVLTLEDAVRTRP